jgi:hypothetical protein
MLAVADPGTMKLDERIAPIDLSSETTVAEWFRALLARGINFHPEESFAELVNGDTGRPLFSAEDAERLDALMGLAYEVCDPCGVALRLVREPDSDPARPRPEPPPAVRESEQGSKIDVTLIRTFLRSALGDDAVVDKVNSLIFDAVAGGIYHRTVVAGSLPGYINELPRLTGRRSPMTSSLRGATYSVRADDDGTYGRAVRACRAGIRGV